MSQSQSITYKAVDSETGKNLVRLEFERGEMKEDQVKADEAKLLPLFISFVQEAQQGA